MLAVRTLLMRRGMTTTELAKALGLTREGVYGRIRVDVPTVKTLKCVAEGLGTTIDDVLEVMRQERIQAEKIGRPVRGDGMIKGAFVPN